MTQRIYLINTISYNIYIKLSLSQAVYSFTCNTEMHHIHYSYCNHPKDCIKHDNKRSMFHLYTEILQTLIELSITCKRAVIIHVF